MSTMSKPKIDRSDWRNLPLEKWNTKTVHAMVIDLNAEKFGIEKYVPMRGWGFEQGVIKRNLTQYGAEDIGKTIERAFVEYRPSAMYPQLTAGFLLTYMLPRIMPQILAEEKCKDRTDSITVDEIASWL